MPWPLLLLLACNPPALEVAGAEDLGAMEQSELIRGRDGGYSARLFGHSVWLFGDTVLSMENDEGSAWCDNSASWTTDTDPGDGLDGFETWGDGRGIPVELLPETEEEQAFDEAHAGEDCAEAPCGARYALWPMALVDDPVNERGLVFYEKIYAEDGAWNFWSRGTGLATWAGLDEAPVRGEPSPGEAEPTLLFQEDEPPFGSAALVEDETLYAWACDGGLRKPCLLGRAALAEATERAAWRFWDGEGWSADLGEAEAVFDAHTMLSVHRLEAFDLYAAFYNEPADDRIYLRTATRLEGPWSSERAVYFAEPSWDGSAAYCGMAHAEYDREGGRFVTLSYFRSPADWEGEIRLIELELEEH